MLQNFNYYNNANIAVVSSPQLTSDPEHKRMPVAQSEKITETSATPVRRLFGDERLALISLESLKHPTTYVKGMVSGYSGTQIFSKYSQPFPTHGNI